MTMRCDLCGTIPLKQPEDLREVLVTEVIDDMLNSDVPSKTTETYIMCLPCANKTATERTPEWLERQVLITNLERS